MRSRTVVARGGRYEKQTRRYLPTDREPNSPSRVVCRTCSCLVPGVEKRGNKLRHAAGLCRAVARVKRDRHLIELAISSFERGVLLRAPLVPDAGWRDRRGPRRSPRHAENTSD